MHIYTLFVNDDRYTVPTIKFIVGEEFDQARSHATQLLAASPHHLSVEFDENGSTLFVISRPQGERYVTWRS